MGETIGTRIGQLRYNNDESQQKLADAISVKREVVKFWESGDRKIKVDDLVKVAKHYNVTTDYLLGLSDIPSIDPDIQTAAKVTGLSVSAIDSIKGLKRSIPIESDLSQVLENERFLKMIPCLDDLRFAYNMCADSMDVINDWQENHASPDEESEDDEDTEKLDEAIELFEEWFPELRMQVFELSEMWSEFLESFIPTKDLISDGKKMYAKYVTGGGDYGKH